MTSRLINEAEAALYLTISPRTLQAWRCRGVGPVFVKVGRAVRYDREVLDAFIAERTHNEKSSKQAAAQNKKKDTGRYYDGLASKVISDEYESSP